MVLTEQKRNYLERLSTKDGVISALAFDQRGALKRLMAKYQDTEPCYCLNPMTIIMPS